MRGRWRVTERMNERERLIQRKVRKVKEEKIWVVKDW